MNKLKLALWNLRVLWLPAVFLFLPFICPILRTVDGFKWLGTIYQLLGISVIFLGVLGKVRYFDLGTVSRYFKGAFQELWQSIRAFFPRKINVAAVVGSLNVTLRNDKAWAHGTVSLSGLTDVQKWLAVETMINNISTGLSQFVVESRDKQESLQKLHDSLNARVEYDFKKSAIGLKTLMTESIQTEILGAIALAIGVFFGTLPEFSNEVLKRLLG